jgi:hypothetical protein
MQISETRGGMKALSRGAGSDFAIRGWQFNASCLAFISECHPSWPQSILFGQEGFMILQMRASVSR